MAAKGVQTEVPLEALSEDASGALSEDALGALSAGVMVVQLVILAATRCPRAHRSDICLDMGDHMPALVVVREMAMAEETAVEMEKERKEEMPRETAGERGAETAETKPKPTPLLMQMSPMA